MSVKIRLKRMGKIRAPFYRVVVMDSRAKRDGRAIEEIGKYHPTEEPSLIEIDGERAQYWLRQGAQPTETVAALLKVTGDWQQAKGLDGGEGTLRVKADKTPKRDLYEAALAAAGSAEEKAGSRKRADKKADAPAADVESGKPSAAKADAPKAEAPKAEANKGTDDGSAPADAKATGDVKAGS